VISWLDSPRALGCICGLVDLCKSSLVFEKNVSFLETQGVPPRAAPEGGSTLRRQGRPFLVFMKECFEHRCILYSIMGLQKKFTEPRGFREKSDVAVQCSKRW
jgi:hypothetical protein